MGDLPSLDLKQGTAEWQMYDEFSRSLTLGLGEIADINLSLIDWTYTNRANLTPGRRFDLIRHHYLADLYTEHKARKMVIYKASQMGASEYAISYSLYCCDIRNATVLYVFPTRDHVSDFSTARIGPALEASDYLKRIVVDWKTFDGKRGADRTTLKRIRNRFLYLRGAKVQKDGRAPQLKSIDADVVVLDEIDEMDHRALPIVSKRIGASSIAEQLNISTPTFAGVGIHKEWGKSDQREWFVACPSCGQKQVMTIDSVVREWDELKRPVMWNGYPDHAFVTCKYCDSKMNRLAPGEWVATRPQFSNRVVGYHLTKLFSPLCDLLEIVEGLKSTDETVRKEIYNQDLGEPYDPKGGRMTEVVLDSLRREYYCERAEGEKTVMGVDIGSLLHIVIRGPKQPETGDRPARFIGTANEFEELDYYIKKYNVSICVIDALPETRKAREFQNRFKHIVWVAYYEGQRLGFKIIDPLKWDEKDDKVDVDRTRLMDITYSRFYDKINTLPINIREIPDYYDQLIAPIRIIDDNNIARYREGTSADHYAHAETYCTVASMGIPKEPAGQVVQPDMNIYKSQRKRRF